VVQISGFRPKSPIISETVRNISRLLRNVNRKSYVADRSGSVPMTLSDRERWDVKGKIFQADLLNNARTV